MPYITNADIELRLGSQAYIELTDDAGTGSANESVVDEARLCAEAEADSHLATRYRTPVDLTGQPGVAAALRAFVLDIAVYRLHGRRPPVPSDVVRRYQEAAAWLARVASGAAQLPATLPQAEPIALGIVAERSSSERTMTRDSLSDV